MPGASCLRKHGEMLRGSEVRLSIRLAPSCVLHACLCSLKIKIEQPYLSPACLSRQLLGPGGSRPLLKGLTTCFLVHAHPLSLAREQGQISAVSPYSTWCKGVLNLAPSLMHTVAMEAIPSPPGPSLLLGGKKRCERESWLMYV